VAPGTSEAGGGERASTLLLDAVRGEAERISVGDILNALDSRAFGLAALIFALPSCVPMPPGVPTVVGVALLIVSLQMVAGRQELWLPAFIARRSFPRGSLVAALEKFHPVLVGIERLARPRMLFMTGRLGAVMIGAVILMMAIILILPLPPGGNFPPALVCALLGMGLAERDGVIVLIGLTSSLLAIIAVWVVTLGFLTFFPVMLEWMRSFISG